MGFWKGFFRLVTNSPNAQMRGRQLEAAYSIQRNYIERLIQSFQEIYENIARQRALALSHEQRLAELGVKPEPNIDYLVAADFLEERGFTDAAVFLRKKTEEEAKNNIINQLASFRDRVVSLQNEVNAEMAMAQAELDLHRIIQERRAETDIQRVLDEIHP